MKTKNEAPLGNFPDGLIAVVKEDCPTCSLISPVLEHLAEEMDLTVYSQDNPAFPFDTEWVVDDTDLRASWNLNVDTVPTLIKRTGGTETDRAVGWNRSSWEQLTGLNNLGVDLPDFRPGCGSLTVHPERIDKLRVRFGESKLASKRIEISELEDEHEALFSHGWSDGLPIVAPTETRVMQMLEGTSREPNDVVALAPPNLVECNVEKIAINAVMAGCRPEYLPIVITAIEAICNQNFNMHGVLATTMSVGPILVVNGPIAGEIGMNWGINALGHGNRANSTIGRAVQLVIRNVGGGIPGGIDRATLGHMGKQGFCFAEDEENSPWTTLSEVKGFERTQNTVTAFCGEGPALIVDQTSRSPESLTRSLAASLLKAVSTRVVIAMDGMLVLSPEHMDRYRAAGWDRNRFMTEIYDCLLVDSDTIIRGAGGIEDGIPADWAGNQIPKFRPEGLLVVHAGGPAGLFSAFIGGWKNGPTGSDPVTLEIKK